MIPSVETARLLDALHELDAKASSVTGELGRAKAQYEALRARVSALQATAARTAGEAEDARPVTSRIRLLETDIRYQAMATTQLQRERCSADADLTLAAQALVGAKRQLSEALSENRAVRRQLDEREAALLQKMRGDGVRERIRALCWVVGRLEQGAGSE